MVRGFQFPWRSRGDGASSRSNAAAAWQDAVWSETVNAGELTVDWVNPHRLRPVLQHIAEAWLDATHHLPSSRRSEDRPQSDFDELPILGQIQWEVWNSMNGAQPLPDIAIAQLTGPVGVLCGYRNYGGKYFFVEHIALHPALCGMTSTALWRNPGGEKVCQALVEAAVDLSHAMGCFGWTACSPLEGTEAAWHHLKFYRHDEFTYRRMGYFS